MKKKLLSVLLIGGMVTTILTGCAGEAKKEKENKEVEISFYTTETGKDDMFMDLISDFESKNEGIKVEYIAAGDDQLQKWMSLIFLKTKTECLNLQMKTLHFFLILRKVH